MLQTESRAAAIWSNPLGSCSPEWPYVSHDHLNVHGAAICHTMSHLICFAWVDMLSAQPGAAPERDASVLAILNENACKSRSACHLTHAQTTLFSFETGNITARCARLDTGGQKGSVCMCE